MGIPSWKTQYSQKVLDHNFQKNIKKTKSTIRPRPRIMAKDWPSSKSIFPRSGSKMQQLKSLKGCCVYLELQLTSFACHEGAEKLSVCKFTPITYLSRRQKKGGCQIDRGLIIPNWRVCTTMQIASTQWQFAIWHHSQATDIANQPIDQLAVRVDLT